jgi:methionyl-tRNA formyltransferase
MKLGFVTCVQLGLSCMKAIYEAGGELALVVTLPDDKAVNKSGRIYLDTFCVQHDVPLLKSPHVNYSEVTAAIEAAHIDWLFIIGWSQIANSAVLNTPKIGVLGMHPTLLPTGRGRAAIPWAILKGLDQTGVTLFKLDEGVDTGPIAAQMVIPLTPQTTATELYAAVESAHIELIRKVIPTLMAGALTLQKQDETLASIWVGRNMEDGEINLRGSVWEAERMVRAVTRPYPGAFYVRDGRKIIVWHASATSISSAPNVNHLKFSDGCLLIYEWELV